VLRSLNFGEILELTTSRRGTEVHVRPGGPRRRPGRRPRRMRARGQVTWRSKRGSERFLGQRPFHDASGDASFTGGPGGCAAAGSVEPRRSVAWFRQPARALDGQTRRPRGPFRSTTMRAEAARRRLPQQGEALVCGRLLSPVFEEDGSSAWSRRRQGANGPKVDAERH